MITAGRLRAAADLWPLLWVSDGGSWPHQYFYFYIYRYLPSILPFLYIYSTYLQQLSGTWIICSFRPLYSSDKSKKCNISTGSQTFWIYFEILLFWSCGFFNFNKLLWNIHPIASHRLMFYKPASQRQDVRGMWRWHHKQISIFHFVELNSSSLKVSTCQYSV